MRKIRRTGFRRFTGLLAAFILLTGCIGWAAGEEDSFSASRVGQIIGFGKNAFSIRAPEDGTLSITVRDDWCVWRKIEEKVGKGLSTVEWDGCGNNEEPLNTQRYHFDFTLRGESGKEYQVSFDSPVTDILTVLQFVLPAGKTAYLNAAEEWFFETKATRDGTIRIEFIPAGEETPVYSCEKPVHKRRIEHYTLKHLDGKGFPGAGEYTIKIYTESRPERIHTFPLRIEARKPRGDDEIPVTGDIMPAAGASDEEIWAKMTAPSAVVDIDALEHQNIYTDPDYRKKTIGTLHGETQCLSILARDGEWAKIGAWNHEDGAYTEGWVPADKLKIVEPNPEYGILVSKKEQTLTLYQRGKRIETLRVSTGKMEKDKYFRETSAGSFLTGLHRVDFSTNGNKYDFVIQYDGGNLLHQIPYSSDGRKDFTKGKEALGTKASHACIRIQEEPGEENGINAYWIWTHLPYRTRIIILDDPEEREAEYAALAGTGNQE